MKDSKCSATRSYITSRDMVSKILGQCFDQNYLTDWPHLVTTARKLLVELKGQQPNFSGELGIVEMHSIGCIYRMSQNGYMVLVNRLQELVKLYAENIVDFPAQEKAA